MGTKWHDVEEIVTKLRQVDILVGQGMTRAWNGSAEGVEEAAK